MATWLPHATDASDIVLDGWNSSTKYTNSTFTTAVDFLNNIADIGNQVGNIPTISEELGNVTTVVSDFQKPTKPDELDIVANFPSVDSTVELTPVDLLDMPASPVLDAEAPVLKEISAPAAFNKTAPTAPTLPTRHYPDAPDAALPTVPTLRELTLPDAPAEITISFDGVLPGQLESAPSTDFVFIENDYASTLLNKINERLLLFLSGFSTGLSPEIEQQIWDRARRRTSVAVRRLKAQNERYWSSAGWDMPGGDLQNKNYEAEQEAINQDISESRAIAIAQAELEQKNLQFSFTTATQIESILIQQANNVQQRAFEAAKYSVQAAIELYGLKVTEFNANIEAYKAHAQVYRDRIQAELAKVEVYKAKLDGQKLLGELNQQDVVIYREQINAVLAIYELYKTKLDAVKTQLQGDELLLNQFESQIKAFDAEIRTKSLEYDNFKIANEVELTKNEVYKSRIAAYSEQVNAFKALVDARKAKQDADIEVKQRIPLEVFKQKSESIRTLVQAESERLKSLTETAKVRSEIYDTETKAETSRIQAEIGAQENEIKKLIAQSNIKIESLKANVSSSLAVMELLSDAAKAGAQVASQLAAASLSSVNLSASISESDSNSTSHSISESSSSSVSTSTIINE
jgi:hypothetical protein